MSTLPSLRDERDDQIEQDDAQELSGVWPDQATVSESFQVFEAALAVDNGSAEAYFNLGMRLLEFGAGLGLEEHAVDAFKKCTELAPDNADAFFHLGFALMNANRPEEALRAYQRASEISPNSPDTIMGLIYANTAIEDFNLSNAWIERLIDMSRAEVEGVVFDKRIFYCWYGVTLILSARMDDAESYFVLSLTASGEPSAFADDAHYGLGVIALRRGNFNVATGHLTAIKTNNNRLHDSLERAIERGEISNEEFLQAIIGRTV